MDSIISRLYDTRVCSPAQNYCRNAAVMEEAADRISTLEAENARLRNRLELIKNRDCECEYDEEGERDILCPSCLAAGALSDGKLQAVLAEALSAVKEE